MTSQQTPSSMKIFVAVLRLATSTPTFVVAARVEPVGSTGFFLAFFFKGAKNFFRRDRQSFDAHADGVEDRVVDHCRRGVHVELAQSFSAEGSRRFIRIGKGMLERRHV